MSLPIGGDIPWPPKATDPDYAAYRENAAWFGGNAQDLTRVYSGFASPSNQAGDTFFDQSTTAQPATTVLKRYFFWARQESGQSQRGRYHVPIASDISTTSSDQLFSDEPRILIPSAHAKRASSGSKKIQARTDEIVNEDGVISQFQEGAEVASALGGTFLQAHWDAEVYPRPMLQVVHPDSAVPFFTWGRLTSVIFWSVIPTSGNDVWRHLELHDKGVVVHGLYKGSSAKLGARQKLTALSEMAGIVAVSEGGVIETGLPGLDCVYVPNMRPNRVRRGSDLGRSDYQGVEDLMDGADETMSSWMRDIRLGKARMFVPEEFIKSQGRGKGGQFNFEQEIYEMLKMTPQSGQPLLTPNQFAIRYEEHERTLRALIERIVQTAGYSGATFGLKGEAVQEATATEVVAREHRTVVTRGKKIRYWSRAISDVLEIMLMIDSQVFKGPGVERPRADFPESVHDSLKDTSQAILQLDQATAISLETKIQMAHPTWDPDELTAEVDRIKTQRPPPTVTTQPPAKPPVAKE